MDASCFYRIKITWDVMKARCCSFTELWKHKLRVEVQMATVPSEMSKLVEYSLHRHFPSPVWHGGARGGSRCVSLSHRSPAGGGSCAPLCQRNGGFNGKKGRRGCVRIHTQRESKTSLSNAKSEALMTTSGVMRFNYRPLKSNLTQIILNRLLMQSINVPDIMK